MCLDNCRDIHLFFLGADNVGIKKKTQINKLKSHGGAKGLDGQEKLLFCPYLKEDPDSYA